MSDEPSESRRSNNLRILLDVIDILLRMLDML